MIRELTQGALQRGGDRAGEGGRRKLQLYRGPQEPGVEVVMEIELRVV